MITYLATDGRSPNAANVEWIINKMDNLVDSHFHIWDLRKFHYECLHKEYEVIIRNILPEEFAEEMKTTPVKHAVFVQCINDSPEETKWVMEVAEKYKFIKGIVAGVGMTNPKLPEILDELQKNPLLKGVRHLLQFEAEDWLARDDVHVGLKQLEDRGLTFDLAMWPKNLKYMIGIAPKFPRLKFVVNHLGIPNIKERQMSPWKEEIAEIAKSQNVYCKLSGLVTAHDWNNWKQEDFKPYVDHVVSCFGIDRCMFASDWPVCTLAKASYAKVFAILNNLLPDLSEEEKLKLYRNNAKDVYRLDI